MTRLGAATTSSSTADPAARLQAWRLETVDLLLRILALVQLGAMIAYTAVYVTYGSYGMPPYAGWVTFAVMAAGALGRGLPYRLRAAILVLPSLAASVLSFVLLGLAPAPTANGLVAVVLATVFLGPWSASAVAATVLAAVLFATTRNPTYAAPVTARAFVEVLRIAPPVVLALGVLALVVRRLSAALDDSVALVRRLEHEAAERARSEAKLRGIFELVPEAVALSRADDRVILDVNPGFERIWGWPRAEVLGRALDAMPVGDDEQRRKNTDRLARDGMLSRVEVRSARRDGTPIDLLVSVRIAELGGERVLVSVSQDVTEEKRMAEALRHAQRLEAMGDLAAGIAHNFNNALGAALPNIEMALEDASEELRPMLEDARAAVRGAVDLARQMNMLARRERDTRREPVDAVPVVREVVSICRNTFDRRILVETDLRTGALVVPGPAGHLHQVLLNLCLNARDALAGRPQPTLRIEVDEAAGPVPGVEGSTTARHALIRIGDNGVGMSADALARLGEPFYTTKPAGQGTGLGLVTAMGIARDAGGRITARSEPGRGATFTVALPVLDAHPEQPAASRVTSTQVGRRILLVDDDALVRGAIARQLSALGAEVVTAGSGEEGIERAEAERFDVVLLDSTMPGIGGAGVLARLRVSRPELPIVIVSGAADPKMAEGAVAVLQKPVTMAELSEMLGRVAAGAR